MMPSEIAREVTRVTKPDAFHRFPHTESRCFQESACACQPDNLQVARRRNSGLRLEQVCKARSGESRCRRELCDGERFMETSSDKFEGAGDSRIHGRHMRPIQFAGQAHERSSI
jgi:hypothetical protein